MKAHGPIADHCTILLVISIAYEQTPLALVDSLDCDLLVRKVIIHLMILTGKKLI